MYKKGDSLSVFVRATDKNGNVIFVSLKPDATGYYEGKLIDTNFMQTAFGKEHIVNYFDKVIDDNDMVYPIGKNKKEVLTEILEHQSLYNFNALSNSNISQSNNKSTKNSFGESIKNAKKSNHTGRNGPKRVASTISMKELIDDVNGTDYKNNLPLDVFYKLGNTNYIENNWKNRGKDTIVITAPILINNNRKYMSVIIEQYDKGQDNVNRYYLHELVVFDDFSNEKATTDLHTTQSNTGYGKQDVVAFTYNLLKDAYDVKNNNSGKYSKGESIKNAKKSNHTNPNGLGWVASTISMKELIDDVNGTDYLKHGNIELITINNLENLANIIYNYDNVYYQQKGQDKSLVFTTKTNKNFAFDAVGFVIGDKQVKLKTFYNYRGKRKGTQQVANATSVALTRTSTDKGNDLFQGVPSSYNLSQSNSKSTKNSFGESIENAKEKQLEIIRKTNPVQDNYHTWIRGLNDIKTFEETLHMQKNS